MWNLTTEDIAGQKTAPYICYTTQNSNCNRLSPCLRCKFPPRPLARLQTRLPKDGSSPRQYLVPTHGCGWPGALEARFRPVSADKEAGSVQLRLRLRFDI